MDASQLPPGFLEALAAQAGREGGDSSPGDWEEVGVEESAGWTRTLSRVQGAVVVVRMEFMADPEGGQGGSSQGTGFVVDAKRGLVVTNRHIVGIAPTIYRITFVGSKEEVKAHAVYRDPVHDFGILKFHPGALLHTTPAELALRPEECRPGAEIRVVGNDAGEQLQILAGTISRVDRNVPEYGPGTYNDFNIAYVGAASNTSGGSSGSPVVNLAGHAVALNAGGSSYAASSMFLPLYPVVRALALVQAGRYVPRGELHAAFLLHNLSECRKLGLPAELEDEIRAAEGARVASVPVSPSGDGTASGGDSPLPTPASEAEGQYNLPVVDRVLPQGAASSDRPWLRAPDGSPAAGLGSLQAGDILLRVNGELVGGTFQRLEAALDGAVAATAGMTFAERQAESARVGVALHAPPTAAGPHDAAQPGRPAGQALCAASEGAVVTPTAHALAVCGTVALTLVRNGAVVEECLPVIDAHTLVPRAFLQMGGAILADLPFCLALSANRPQRGVAILEPGMMLAPLSVLGPVGGSLLHSVDGVRLPTLAHAAALLAAFPEGSMRQFAVVDPGDHLSPPGTASATMHRRFAQCRLLSRNTAADIASATARASGERHREWRVTPLPVVQDDADAAAAVHHFAALVSALTHALEAGAPSAVAPMLRSASMEGEEAPSTGAGGTHVQDGMQASAIARAALAELAGAGPAPVLAAGLASPDAAAALQGASTGLPRGVEDVRRTLLLATARILVQQRIAGLADEEGAASPAALHAALALVTVHAQQPFSIEGLSGPGMGFDLMALLSGAAMPGDGGTVGTGVVLDVRHGLVLVPKETVPIMLSVVTVQVGPLRVPARVVFVHPSANFTLVQFDTQRSGLCHILRALRVGRTGLLNARYSRPLLEHVARVPAARDAAAAAGCAGTGDAARAAVRASVERATLFFDAAVGLDLLDAGPADIVTLRVPQEDAAEALVYPADPRGDVAVARDMLRGAYGQFALSSTLQAVTLSRSNTVFAGSVPRWALPVPVEGQLPAYTSELPDAHRVTDCDLWKVSLGDAGVPPGAGGVLVDGATLEVRALVSGTGNVLGAEYFGAAAGQVLARLTAGADVSLRALEVGVSTLSVNDAVLQHGLSLERASWLMQASPRNEALQVRHSGHAALRHNDILLAFEPEDVLPEGVTSGPAAPGPARAAAVKDSTPAALRQRLAQDLWVSPAQAEDGLLRPPPVLFSIPVLSLTQMAARCATAATITLRVLRGGAEVWVRVPTADVDVRAASSKEVLAWAGLYLHAPDAVLRRVLPPKSIPRLPLPAHREEWDQAAMPTPSADSPSVLPTPPALPAGLASPGPGATAGAGDGEAGSAPSLVPAGVICSFVDPAADVQVGGTVWVTEVNGVSTPTLLDVLHVVTRLPDGSDVRIKTVAIASGQTALATVLTNELAFPPTRFVHTASLAWEREVLTAPYPPCHAPAPTAGTGLDAAVPPMPVGLPGQLLASRSADGLAGPPPAFAPTLARQSSLSTALAGARGPPVGGGEVAPALALDEKQRSELEGVLGAAVMGAEKAALRARWSADEVSWFTGTLVSAAVLGVGAWLLASDRARPVRSAVAGGLQRAWAAVRSLAADKSGDS